MEWASGNIYIRPTVLPAGERVDGHTHNFDHTTIVFRGVVQVRKWRPIVEVNGEPRIGDDGKPMYWLVGDKTFISPAHFLVEAGSTHEITALEDTEFWCVYSHRTPQGDVVEEYNGWTHAYV